MDEGIVTVNLEFLDHEGTHHKVPNIQMMRGQMNFLQSVSDAGTTLHSAYPVRLGISSDR